MLASGSNLSDLETVGKSRSVNKYSAGGSTGVLVHSADHLKNTVA